ncbi:MAG: YoaK family protein [Bdellovibrionales bacterium]|jgi:uncharacterized membrane protein YoaK (UPF0700 family)|nr:YoaK family protein [Bdellovibrionales bacterium]
MFCHRASEHLELKTILDWFLLAFLAGNINTGGYLACQRFVSHITGFATLAGVDAALGLWGEAIGILSVPLFFLLGVLISAYHVDRRVFQGKKPRYSFVMGLETLCLSIAGIGGILGWWSEFGNTLQLSRDYFFLALLCMASGLQNAALTSSSGSTLRTTHLTGTTTDLGIGMMRWYYRPEDESRKQEYRANWLKVGMISAFMIGSGAGAFLYVHLKYWGFVLPIGIASYATWTARRKVEAIEK